MWSARQDEELTEKRRNGLAWKAIERSFPGKSGNACRKRYERLMQKKREDELDGDKFEDLANAYMQVRKEMWTILAERVGSRWDLVELKVRAQLLG